VGGRATRRHSGGYFRCASYTPLGSCAFSFGLHGWAMRTRLRLAGIVVMLAGWPSGADRPPDLLMSLMPA